MLLSGQSGAQISFYGDYVFKTGYSQELRERLNREMHHIVRLRQTEASEMFPVVHGESFDGFTTVDGYSMEKLDCRPESAIADQRAILSRLRLRVWGQTPHDYTERDWQRPFLDWMLQNTDSRDFLPAIFLLLHGRYPTLFQDVDLIHGDPTMENTMYRGNVPVLIDPVAGDPKLPRNRYLDVGKMLQSSMGYERFKYPDLFKYDPFAQTQSILSMLHMEEREVSLFWCMVHHYRIIARLSARSEFEALPSDPKMIEYCRETIDKLRWMVMPLCLSD